MNINEKLNKKLQEKIDKLEAMQAGVSTPETEAIYAGYQKAKAPNGISKLSLMAPNKDKVVSLSNLLVLALKENRVLFFTLLMSFFFFGALCPQAWLVYIIYLLFVGLVGWVFKNNKLYPYAMIGCAGLSYLLALYCKYIVYLHYLLEAQASR